MPTPELLTLDQTHEARRGGIRPFMRGAIAIGLALSAFALTGCPSEADTASKNLSTAADNFEINRRIVFINGVTDNIPLIIEGRCSIEVDGADHQLEVTCKTGRDEFKKHFLGLSDNMSYIVEQQEAAKVDVYHTRIILKPEALIPNFDLNSSGGDK